MAQSPRSCCWRPNRTASQTDRLVKFWTPVREQPESWGSLMVSDPGSNRWESLAASLELPALLRWPFSIYINDNTPTPIVSIHWYPWVIDQPKCLAFETFEIVLGNNKFIFLIRAISAFIAVFSQFLSCVFIFIRSRNGHTGIISIISKSLSKWMYRRMSSDV